MKWLFRDLALKIVSIWRAAEPEPRPKRLELPAFLDDTKPVESMNGLIVAGPVHCTRCEHRGNALIPLGEVAVDPRWEVVNGLVCPLCRRRTVTSD
jgi:hypothetical protein